MVLEIMLYFKIGANLVENMLNMQEKSHIILSNQYIAHFAQNIKTHHIEKSILAQNLIALCAMNAL